MIGKFLSQKFFSAHNSTIHLSNLILREIAQCREELEEIPEFLKTKTSRILDDLESELETLPTRLKNFLELTERAGDFFDELFRQLHTKH